MALTVSATALLFPNEHIDNVMFGISGLSILPDRRKHANTVYVYVCEKSPNWILCAVYQSEWANAIAQLNLLNLAN